MVLAVDICDTPHPNTECQHQCEVGNIRADRIHPPLDGTPRASQGRPGKSFAGKGRSAHGQSLSFFTENKTDS